MRAVSVHYISIPLVAISLAMWPAFGQSPLTQLTFGGSGVDSIHGVTTDAAGNIYVVGTTYSADLPVLHAYQPVNSGTQIVYSPDAGATWKPLASPFAPGPTFPTMAVAADPTNAAVVYVASGSKFCRSQDTGQTFQCSSLAFLASLGTVTSLTVDPHSSSTIYLCASAPGGVFKSTDSGATWNPANQGLPQTGFADTVAIDPFQSATLFAWTGEGGFVSHDGGASWTASTLQYPSGVSTGETFLGFFFDAATPGVVYGPAFQGTPGRGNNFTIQKSTDHGQTWAPVSLPFSDFIFIGPDPKSAGVLYAATYGSSSSFWRSSDGGVTWTSNTAPSGLVGPLAFDPQNPQIIVGGFYGANSASQPATYRSADGGKTWTATTERALQTVFTSSGTVYGTAYPTSDAFLAKFLPDGKTPVFATYFGGAGNDTGNVLTLDPSGNIWIGGNTSSPDLPVTQGAFQASLRGQINGFLAKFSTDGQLVASTYLGGSLQDTLSSLAAGPQGTMWAGGRWSSIDFPFPTRQQVPPSPAGYLIEFDSAAQSALVSLPLDGFLDTNGNGIAVDSSGNVIVAGSTDDPNFNRTVQPLPGPSSGRSSRAFVQKLDASGATIYSTAFGGAQPAPIAGKGVGFTFPGNLENYGVAAAVDRDGNAYIAGYTDATDFPTTAGAYQTTLADACPYPALENNTGLIGVISTFLMDDVFIVKLSADGKTALYSTLVGGQCFDHPVGLAVDATGRVAITGETDSFDYPEVAAVEASPPYAEYSSFISVLNSSGTALDLSTYLAAGSTPVVAAAPGGAFDIAGSIGPNAQSQTFSGAYTAPYTGPPAHGFIGLLTASPTPPPVNLTQIRNAFSLQTGPVAPGEIVALSVLGFTPDQSVDIGLYPQAPLTTTLGGVKVLVDGKPAYLMTVFPGKIVCIIPAAIAGQTTTAIQVITATGASNTLNVDVSATAFGMLSLDGSGTGAANARNADGTPNTLANPAPVGSQVTVYFTGGGVTTPPEADGVLPATLGVAPIAYPAIFPSGGTAYALPGFVPGIFAYTFTVPKGSFSPLQVNTETNFYQSQVLTIYVR